MCLSSPATIEPVPAEAANDPEPRPLWRAHCLRMAEATHALADWCEDLEMMRTYLDLAAAWLRMADGAAAEPS